MKRQENESLWDFKIRTAACSSCGYYAPIISVETDARRCKVCDLVSQRNDLRKDVELLLARLEESRVVDSLDAPAKSMEAVESSAGDDLNHSGRITRPVPDDPIQSEQELKRVVARERSNHPTDDVKGHAISLAVAEVGMPE